MSDEVRLYDEADQLKGAGKLEEAAAKLAEALAENDQYALAHSALAVVLQRMGKHDEALVHAKRVAELEPMDPFSFTGAERHVSTCLCRHGQYGLHPPG